MVQLNLTAKYLLHNKALNPSSNALASTPQNDSLLLVPPGTDPSQTWYFTPTTTTDHVFCHTLEKGDYTVLDVYSNHSPTSLDLHFFPRHQATGQWWRLHDQADGTVKLSNNFTGPDMFLAIAPDTLRPTLSARDSASQNWILSLAGPEPSASPAASPAASPSPSRASSTCTGPCANPTTATGGHRHRLSPGTIAGAVTGSVAALCIVGGLILWRRGKRTTTTPRPVDPTAQYKLHVRL